MCGGGGFEAAKIDYLVGIVRHIGVVGTNYVITTISSGQTNGPNVQARAPNGIIMKTAEKINKIRIYLQFEIRKMYVCLVTPPRRVQDIINFGDA